MKRKHIAILVGTRPDAIKMAPLILRLKNNPAFRVSVVSSRQHTHLLDEVLNNFKIVPDHFIDSSNKRESLGELVGPLTSALEALFLKIQPEFVLGHGDTATCFSGALASFHTKTKFVHVEAGLRSFDLQSPFPEEFYRQSISKIATLHFAPDQQAKENLVSEGISGDSIFITGNSIAEALFLATQSQSPVAKATQPYAVITLHRREKSLQDFLNIKTVLKHHPEKLFYVVGHPNPKVKDLLAGTLAKLDNVKLLEPQGYFNFVSLLRGAAMIITDSGGVQEEASLLSCPIVVYREKTERALPLENSVLTVNPLELSSAITACFKLEKKNKVFSLKSKPTLAMANILREAV